MKTRWSRREFLKTTTAAVVLGAAEKALSAAPAALQRRRLGKTGEMVSCIGFGSGTRFCSIESEDAAQALLERAFNFRINYFDTAGSYTRRDIERLSEKRLGEFSKTRRKDIFLATKIDPRDRDGALRSVETSLKFLQTDYLDLIQIHSLSNFDDLDRIGRPDGVLTAVNGLKDRKSCALHRHHRPQRRNRHGRSAAPPRLRYRLNGAQRSAIRQSDRTAKNGTDPRLRAVRSPGRVTEKYGHPVDESHGPRDARRRRRGPRCPNRAFTIQLKPARRVSDNRLRANGAARQECSSRYEFHADQRKRQAETKRKSRPVTLGLAELFTVS